MSESPSDALRDVYELRAELEYPAPVAPPDRSVDRKFERVAELVVARLPCRSFLDAGCGDGRYLPLLAEAEPRPERIAATDISERILETARAAAETAGMEPELVRANLEALPFDDESFELVLCTQVIEHLLDVRTALGELARVLTRGGALVLTTDNSRNVVTKALWAPRQALVRLLHAEGRKHLVHFPETEFAPDELARLVRESGLVTEEMGTARFLAPPPFGDRAQRLLNRIDKRMSPHLRGDILYVVATKPR
jgi:ubiquinone/menaquinone biosynthesis C-methylase UbiE